MCTVKAKNGNKNIKKKTSAELHNQFLSLTVLCYFLLQNLLHWANGTKPLIYQQFESVRRQTKRNPMGHEQLLVLSRDR